MFLLKSLNKTEKNYEIHNKEMLVVIRGLENWRHLLEDTKYKFKVSQTSFSLYRHNQWTDFHKLSCAGKPQMRAIRIYMGGTKATTNN